LDQHQYLIVENRTLTQPKKTFTCGTLYCKNRVLVKMCHVYLASILSIYTVSKVIIK